ncbi:MAG: hypothetical protein V4573_00160, partial [Pseudomonadota bacterium]
CYPCFEAIRFNGLCFLSPKVNMQVNFSAENRLSSLIFNVYVKISSFQPEKMPISGIKSASKPINTGVSSY